MRVAEHKDLVEAPVPLSRKFNIREEDLGAYDVFDCIVNVDNKFWFDPFLMRKGTGLFWNQQTLNELRDEISKAYQSILNDDGLYWRFFRFDEFPYSVLGMTESKPNIFRREGETNIDFMRALRGLPLDELDPYLALTAPRMATGVGQDKVSDFVCNMLVKKFVVYTKEVARDLSLETVKVPGSRTLHDCEIEGLSNGKYPILFVPRSMLRKLTIANDLESGLKITEMNARLRARMEEMLTAYRGGARRGRPHVYREFAPVFGLFRRFHFAGPDLEAYINLISPRIEDAGANAEIESKRARFAYDSPLVVGLRSDIYDSLDANGIDNFFIETIEKLGKNFTRMTDGDCFDDLRNLSGIPKVLKTSAHAIIASYARVHAPSLRVLRDKKSNRIFYGSKKSPFAMGMIECYISANLEDFIADNEYRRDLESRLRRIRVSKCDVIVIGGGRPVSFDINQLVQRLEIEGEEVEGVRFWQFGF